MDSADERLCFQSPRFATQPRAAVFRLLDKDFASHEPSASTRALMSAGMLIYEVATAGDRLGAGVYAGRAFLPT
jgi:hypothetical protein